MRYSTLRGLLLAVTASFGLHGCNTIPSNDSAQSSATCTDASTEACASLLASLSAEPWPELANGQGPTVWNRMRSGLQLDEVDHARVDREVKEILKSPRTIDRIATQSKPFIQYVVEQIDERGMPMEFAILPAIESGFTPTAASPYNAAGLWQLVPGTGRRFGLDQNEWVDERLDVVESTRAALDLLQDLNKQFDGDWALTLAAYNAGEGNVRKAMARNQAKGKKTDFWSLELPGETKRFVPRVMAMAKVFSDPVRYDLSIPSVPDRPYFASVTIKGAMDLNQAAQAADVPFDEFRRLNAGYKKRTTPSGTSLLNVPVAKADRFIHMVAQQYPEHKLVSMRYRVQEGDTLERVAGLFHVNQDDLRRLNRLASDQLETGSSLMIPADARVASSQLPVQELRKQADAGGA